jgi:hypothetical protein
MRMQHLKRRHKRCIGVQDSRTKEARSNQRRNPRRGQVSQRQVAHRTVLSGVHRTVRWDNRTDCAEGPQTGALSCSTGLSGVHRTYGNGRIQRSTATAANGRLTWRAPDSAQCLSGGAPDYPVHPTTESCCFLSNG